MTARALACPPAVRKIGGPRALSHARSPLFGVILGVGIVLPVSVSVPVDRSAQRFLFGAKVNGLLAHTIGSRRHDRVASTTPKPSPRDPVSAPS